jgi:hypothetical protein
MKCSIWGIAYAGLVVLASAAIAGDNTVGATVNGVEIGEATSKNQDGKAETPHNSCINRCSYAEVNCSTDVRRARSDCERNAASGGRDPFGGYRSAPRDPYASGSYEYAYFCAYFNNPSLNCGSDRNSRACASRFAVRYDVCIDAIESNIAALRFECYKSEKDAKTQCRQELRDCQAACPP